MSDPRRLMLRALLLAAGAAVLAAPLSLGAFWLQAGLFAMAAMIGAIGLGILFGTAGQLSLGHAFFVAIGAYSYAYLAGDPASGSSLSAAGGLGWPPLAALVGAVVLAGLAGALFSPISGRLRGIYLGLASLGLVFLGQHILFNAESITGGYTGRNVEPFAIAGFNFTGGNPDLVVLGVIFGPLERLWYLGIVLTVIAWWWARNLKKSRHGRAFVMVRDSEVAASSMGVHVVRYKAAAFVVSSIYAGLAGVLLAVVYGRIVPESFGFLLSVDFLIMVVLGGAASTRGVIAGAGVISLLPLVLAQYSAQIPLVGDAGSGGFSVADLSRIIYGVAIVLVLLYAPGGLAAAIESIRRRRHQPQSSAPSSTGSTTIKEPIT